MYDYEYFTRGTRHSKISGKTQNTWLFFPDIQHFNKSKINIHFHFSYTQRMEKNIRY